MGTTPNPATSAIGTGNAAVQQRYPFDDLRDKENARRGFVGTIDDTVIRGADGRVVWDLGSYSFLEEQAPDTANPSLWRQARLVAEHGLFEVTDGIHQIRGLDLSNMTLVEGERGVFVIDPLISTETAAAGLALYRKHRGDRPVTGVLYTHSHVDHFGGVRGLFGFMRGTTFIALIDAVLILVGLLILRVPGAGGLAALVFVGAYIPFIGAFLSGTVAVLVALGDGGVGKALWVLGVVVAVQVIEGNLLQPVIQSRTVSLHPAVVMLAVTGGTAVAGILGALLAVPLTAAASGVVAEWRELAGRDAEQ